VFRVPDTSGELTERPRLLWVLIKLRPKVGQAISEGDQDEDDYYRCFRNPGNRCFRPDDKWRRHVGITDGVGNDGFGLDGFGVDEFRVDGFERRIDEQWHGFGEFDVVGVDEQVDVVTRAPQPGPDRVKRLDDVADDVVGNLDLGQHDAAVT